MGRKPSRWSNLPPGMRARPRGNKIHYYLDTGERPRRELPLGSDYNQAVLRWAELVSQPAPASSVSTFGVVAHAYRRDVFPTKAARTQLDNEKEMAVLLEYFNTPPAPLDDIEPTDIRAFMKWRVKGAQDRAKEMNAKRRASGRPEVPVDPTLGQTRANREKALFSHIWNYARGEGYTKQPNPCAGIKGFRETGRDVAPDAALFDRVLACGDAPLQLAMRLADLIGQRPADVLKVSEAHISGPVPGGILHVQQGKTGEKLRIEIGGELAALIQEARAYKASVKKEKKVAPMSLLVNGEGDAFTASMLRSRFDEAREKAGVPKKEFQFRDLRAKTATDTDAAGGTRAAQAVLGHTTEVMTAHYIRRKAGRKVKLSK